MDDDAGTLVGMSERSVNERVADFSELLKSISSLDDKKRELWRQIYENAVSDRQNSYVMFAKLAQISKEDSTQHAVHGKTMATFLERMSRANDQLIRLAELVAKAQSGTESIDPNDMFDRIKGH